MNKEIFKKIEGKLYNYFRDKKLIYTLKDNIACIEKRIIEIEEDIKNVNVSVDLYRSTEFAERVQTSLKAGSNFENQICDEIGKLEKEHIFLLSKLLKNKRKLREQQIYINSFDKKIECLTEEDRQFLELKYGDRESIISITRKLNIAKATVYRKRDELVYLVSLLID